MNWDCFEAKANDIWGEFWGIVKFIFWDMPIIFVKLGVYILGLLLIVGLIVGAVILLLSITF